MLIQIITQNPIYCIALGPALKPLRWGAK